MNQTHTKFNAHVRKYIDLQIAFSSTLKSLSYKKADLYTTTVPTDNLVEGAKQMGRLKRICRLIAGKVYRLLVPFFRPFAFRFRRYFLNYLLENMRHYQFDLASEFEAKMKEMEEKIIESVLKENNNKEMEEKIIESILKTNNIQQMRNNGAVYCGPEAMLINTRSGYIICDPNDHVLLACLINDRELEKGIRSLLEIILQPGDFFIDVGANLGLLTLAAARAMKGSGRIIAFEPHPVTHKLLEKNIYINGFVDLVKIHMLAISHHQGLRNLYLGKTSGHHSLFPLSDKISSKDAALKVDVISLDEMLQRDESPTCIKIDVEGAELEVLMGAQSIIERNPEIIVIVEFGPSHLKRVGHSIDDWFACFMQLGFIYRVINACSGKLEVWPIEKLRNVESANLCFARPDAAIWKKVEVL